ncbi:MAG TPA: imidazoleglycerol-phosphate dehydratase HisB [Myxococcales bacterium]|nr:imidazoleglycerol-phosphate dehydratase HisB [Myxococcales bacterium]
MSSRTGKVARRTKETDLSIEVELDGSGVSQVTTGIPFFDHMLETLSKHSAIDVKISCKGDLHIDQHHTVEDTGIALGSAIDQALGDRKGIARAGCFYFPLDEALARSVIDLSGRSFLAWNVALEQGPRSAMDLSVLEGFFKAIADNARANVHIDLLTGRDFHHGAEAIFKSFARALRQAVTLDPRTAGSIPSTKGVL